MLISLDYNQYSDANGVKYIITIRKIDFDGLWKGPDGSMS
jgi:hypothetical protein